MVVAGRTRGVARHDTAQARGGLGGVRGEELLGARIELVEGLQALLVPAIGGNGLVCQGLSQGGEHHARLEPQVVGAVLAPAQTEEPGHAREVHDMSAIGHGARRKTCAGTLYRDGNGAARRAVRMHRSVTMELAQQVTDVLLGCWEGNGIRLAHGT